MLGHHPLHVVVELLVHITAVAEQEHFPQPRHHVAQQLHVFLREQPALEKREVVLIGQLGDGHAPLLGNRRGLKVLLIGRHEIHLGGRDDRHVAPMGPDVVPEDQHGIADQQHDLRRPCRIPREDFPPHLPEFFLAVDEQRVEVLDVNGGRVVRVQPVLHRIDDGVAARGVGRVGIDNQQVVVLETGRGFLPCADGEAGQHAAKQDDGFFQVGAHAELASRGHHKSGSVMKVL